jgi:competence protein ComEA
MRLCSGLVAFCMVSLWSTVSVAGAVNINTADAETLAVELTGIGPALAAEIVRDREQNGRYDSPDALTRVKGVGTRIVEMNRENIRVSDQPAPR